MLKSTFTGLLYAVADNTGLSSFV